MVSVIHGKKHALGQGFETIGHSNVPRTSFSIKDHERIDVPGILMEPKPDDGVISTGPGLQRIKTEHFIQSRPAIANELRNLPLPVSFSENIYLVHALQRDTRLDVVYDGRHLGSKAIRSFFEEHSPLLKLHGHIHESPSMSGSWFDYVGKTLCVNPGHSGSGLHAVAMDVNDLSGSLVHAVYGRASR